MVAKVFLSLSAVAGALLTGGGRALACAVCLSGADAGVTEGYNASVLFLMATPYLVAASIAAGLFVAYRRALKRRQEADEEQLMLTLNQEDSSR